MKKEEAIAFVISELGKHNSQNEIIRSLCEQTGAPWSDAEKFVRQVEEEHSHEIEARQSPFLIAMGVIIMLAGLGLVVSATQYFISVAQQDTLGMILSAPGIYTRIGSLFAGLFMLAGGIIGLRKPILALLEAMDGS